jgi:hypothetical protein
MSLDLGAGDQQGPFNLVSPDVKVKSELAINIFQLCALCDLFG